LSIQYPLIMVNFKTYSESTGANALAIARHAEQVSKEYGARIALALQPADILRVTSAVGIPVFAQHVDAEKPGSHTGHVTPESVKEAGACGALVNHSEHRLRLDIIEDTIKRCRSLGLLTCTCANSSLVGKSLAALEPDMIAVEPPELIGSGISVSKAKPEVISESVKAIRSVSRNVRPLCGAGITTGEDVSSSIRLGAEGVLVASGVVKAKDPKAVLIDFAKALHA